MIQQRNSKKYRRYPWRFKEKHMTVAIAALCGYPNDRYIIAVADHMITSGDIQFEQPQPKMWQFNESCVAIMYGLSAAQSKIADDVQISVTTNKITFVSLIAGLYGRKMRDYIRQEAEADILAPLNLTVDDLTQRNSSLKLSQVERLSKQMQTYYHGSGLDEDLGGAIIVGVDTLGCHIYGVEGGHVTCYDMIGFCAAGGGQWHASSQFMFSGFTRMWPFTDALSLAYSAKKRAEVAPGVGLQTDILLISNGQPNILHATYDSPFVTGLENIYQESKKRIDSEISGQHKQVKKYFDELIAKAEASRPPESPIQAEPPTPKRPTRKKKSPPASQG
jgi:hypothetical protein